MNRYPTLLATIVTKRIVICIALLWLATPAWASFEQALQAYSVGEYEQAAELWRDLAEDENSEAQHALGVMYFKGEGVRRDTELAVSWFLRAAEQSHQAAMFNAGVAFWNGEGAKIDHDEALEWWQKASDSGYAAAQYNLGIALYLGEYIQQDIDQALHWLRKSAEQDYASATEVLALIEDNASAGVDDATDSTSADVTDQSQRTEVNTATASIGDTEELTQSRSSSEQVSESKTLQNDAAEIVAEETPAATEQSITVDDISKNDAVIDGDNNTLNDNTHSSPDGLNADSPLVVSTSESSTATASNSANGNAEQPQPRDVSDEMDDSETDVDTSSVSENTSASDANRDSSVAALVQATLSQSPLQSVASPQSEESAGALINENEQDESPVTLSPTPETEKVLDDQTLLTVSENVNDTITSAESTFDGNSNNSAVAEVSINTSTTNNSDDVIEIPTVSDLKSASNAENNIENIELISQDPISNSGSQEILETPVATDEDTPTVVATITPDENLTDASMEIESDRIGKDSTPVYASNNEQAPLLETLEPETPIRIIRSAGDWLNIQAPGGFPVWVYNKLIDVSNSHGIITANGVRARSLPSTSRTSLFIGLFDKGTRVHFLETRGDWVKVRSPEIMSAWVKAENAVQQVENKEKWDVAWRQARDLVLQLD